MHRTDTPEKVASTDKFGGWEPPPGWIVQEPDWLPGCVVTGSSAIGWVTVDMKARFFSPGFSTPRRWNGLENSKGFTGNGWQRRIMDAAEEHLRACNSGA